MKVQEIMIKDVISVEIPNSRSEVLDLFTKYGLKAIPVLKKGTKSLVGIVTQEDLIKKSSEDQLALLMNRDPVTVSTNDDIKDAIKIMIDKDIRRLPVTDKDKKLKGMITIEDIISKAISKLNMKSPIKPYIIRTFTTIWEGTPLPILPYIMRLANIQALPVLNDNGKLSGIVSNEDLIKESEIVSENTKSSISATTEGDFSWDTVSTLLITENKLKLSDKPVREIMAKDLVTSIESTSISECANKMRKYNINQLPVLDARGELVGLITDKNLLKALYE